MPAAGAQTEAVELSRAIGTFPTAGGETYFTRTLDVTYGGGSLLLSRNPDGTGNVSTDDVLRLFVTRPDGTATSLVRDYSPNCVFPQTQPPADVSNLFGVGRNRVRVELADDCGVVGGSTAYWLVGNVEGVVLEEQLMGGCDWGGATWVSSGDAVSSCSTLSDPVIGATGWFVRSETDVELPSVGIPFALTRTYTSGDTASGGPLGTGWTHSYAASLAFAPDGDVTLRAPNGQRVQYERYPDGSFVGPPSGRSELKAVPGGYELKRQDQTLYRFDGQGRLQEIRDRNGNAVTLAYDGSGRLSSVTDTAGRVVSVTNDSSGRIAAVNPPDGRQVNYAYTDGYLTSATDPRGEVTRYTYDDAYYLALDGIDDYVRVPDDPTFENAGQLTLEAIVRFDSLESGRAQRIVSSRQPLALGFGQWYLRAVGDKLEARFQGSGFSPPAVSGTTALKPGVWYHVAATLFSTPQFCPAACNGTTRLYLNGVEEASATSFTSGDFNFQAPLILGQFSTEAAPAGERLDGQLAEARLWTRTRSQTQIAASKGEGALTGTEPGLAGYWKLVGGSGTSVPDSSPSGNHGTILGGGSWPAEKRITDVTSPTGERVVRNTYASDGRVIEQADGLANVSRFTYAAEPDGTLTTTMFDARGQAWTDVYRNNVLQNRSDPLGNETALGWDDALNPTHVPRPGSNPWALTWDANRNLTKRKAVAPFDYEETFTYSALNNLTSSTDGLGRTTTYGYDTDGNLTSITEPGGATTTITRDPGTGLPTAIHDPRGKTWTYTYDGGGSSAYPGAVLADNPWGYWRLGETAGTTAADASGNGRNGTYTGGVTLGAEGAIAGDADTAASFDGTNDHVAPSATLNTGVATIEAWIKVDAVPSTVGEIVGFHNGLASGITDKRLVLANDGKIYFHVWDGANRYTSTPSVTVPLGQWTHVVGVTNGTQAKVYQDAVEVGSVAAGQSFAAYTVPNVFVGAGGVHADGGTGYFPGQIDEAAVYPSALSATRIEAHHETGLQTGPTGPGPGNLTEVRSPLGLRTTMTYDARGFMTSRTDPRGNEPGATKADYTTTYTYDDAGNPLTEINALDGVTTYGYDAAARLVSRTDPRDKTTTYAYNAAGEVTQIVAPDGGVTTYTYDESGNLLSETDPEGGVASYTYDASGRMATKIDPRGKTQTYAYDAAGQLLSEETALGNETTYAYDALGRLTSRTDPRGNASGATPSDFTWTFDYDPVGNLIEETDPLGNTTSSTFDHRGRILTRTDAASKISTYGYDAAGNLLLETDPLGNTTARSYDDDGRHVLTTDPRGKTSSLAYDAAGNLTRATTPLGFKETMTYDALNRTTSRTDPRGNQPGATPSDFRTTFTYDPVGNLLQETDPLGKKTTYAYDAVGNRTTKTDALGRQTTYTYDLLGRMKTLLAPDQALTSYAYDPAGNPTSRTDPNNHTTTIAYDDDGRLVSETTPLGNVRSYAYDPDGNQTTETDPRGNATPTAGDFTITNTYDRAGRLSGIGYSDATPDVSFTYDPRGLRTQMTDGGGTETRTYDDAGRLTQVARGTTSVSYLYDPASNVTRRTYPGGAATDLSYDDDGRLASVSGPGGVSTYAYDASGREIQLTRPNGTITFSSYDRVGRPSLVSHRKGGSAFASYTYAYDDVGNPTTLGETPEGQITYRYDPQDRVIEACYVQACGALLNPVFIRYTYDKVGNRLTETRQTGTTTYTYDADDRLLSTTGGSGTTAYTHDQAGNMTGAGARTFAYDLAGLTKTITDGASTTTYAYDGDRKRTSAASGGSTTKFVWDPNAPIPEPLEEQNASGGLVRRYVQGNELLSVTTPGATTWYHGDSLGSVISVTDAAGDQDWSHAYEPFGADRATVQRDLLAPTQPMRFTGQHLDATGLYHLRARQYDPVLGRFTSRDPLPQSVQEPFVSMCAYVGNRPTVLVDPSGLRGVPLGPECSARVHGAFKVLSLGGFVRGGYYLLRGQFGDAAESLGISGAQTSGQRLLGRLSGPLGGLGRLAGRAFGLTSAISTFGDAACEIYRWENDFRLRHPNDPPELFSWP